MFSTIFMLCLVVGVMPVNPTNHQRFYYVPRWFCAESMCQTYILWPFQSQEARVQWPNCNKLQKNSMWKILSIIEHNQKAWLDCQPLFGKWARTPHTRLDSREGWKSSLPESTLKEWAHLRILSTDSKGRTTFDRIINNSNRSITFFWTFTLTLRVLSTDSKVRIILYSIINFTMGKFFWIASFVTWAQKLEPPCAA